jgi:predicted Ser/Thr protein kinase
LPADAPMGICPACLASAGFGIITNEVQAEKRPFQPPTPEELAVHFPQLEVLGLLGCGGMGAVYKARQKRLDRVVALKILPRGIGTGPGFAERFEREARALAKLHHPRIVTLYEFGEADGLYYFLMEFVDGLTLRQLLSGRRLAPAEALAIVPKICDALQFAHDAGIVHRDIKPENILLGKDGEVKIADFGVAKIVADAGAAEPGSTGSAPAPSAQTEVDGVIGTPAYMAPEQMTHPGEVDHRADIYALGVVLYQMLTGELPAKRVEPPSNKVRIDVRLDEVVLRALEKDPNLRYQRAGEVKTAVEEVTNANASAGAAANEALPAAEPVPPDVLTRDFSLDIGSCLRRGWELVRSDFWPLVGITALGVALFGAIGAAGSGTEDSRGNRDSSPMAWIFYLLIKGPLVAGLQLYFLHKIRGRRATIETAFSGFRSQRYLHLFLAGFVTTTLNSIGYFFLVLPGIYLTIAWTFTLALVIDKQLHFWSAMELSRKVVTRHWWMFFIFALVLTLLKFAGLLAFLVGLFLTLPVAVAALMYAYEDVFSSGKENSTPAREVSGE